MLPTAKILLLNPDRQMVYLVIGNGFRIRSQVPCQSRHKAAGRRKNRSNPYPPAIPLPTDEQDEDAGASRLTLI